MVYGVVRRHSGKIEIESALSKGTVIRLGFSVAATSSEPLAPPAALPEPLSLKVLLVDDDPLVMKSLRAILEIDGHVVTSASEVKRLLTSFERQQSA